MSFHIPFLVFGRSKLRMPYVMSTKFLIDSNPIFPGLSDNVTLCLMPCIGAKLCLPLVVHVSDLTFVPAHASARDADLYGVIISTPMGAISAGWLSAFCLTHCPSIVCSTICLRHDWAYLHFHGSAYVLPLLSVLYVLCWYDVLSVFTWCQGK